MNRNIEHNVDEFVDWLDEFVDGNASTVSSADPDMRSMQHAARRIHDADVRTARYTAAIAHRGKTWDEVLSTSVRRNAASMSVVQPAPVTRTVVRYFTNIRATERVATFFLIAAVVFATTVGVGKLADEGGDDDQASELIPFDRFDNQSIAVPWGTPLPATSSFPSGVSSSFPYPNTDECTVEPLTLEEITAQLTEANETTEFPREYYAQAIEPTNEEVKAIMLTFRTWQACGLNDRATAYRMALETARYDSINSPPFNNYQRPVSDDLISQWAEVFAVGNQDDLLTPIAYDPNEDYGKPEPPEFVELPEDATPIPLNTTGNAASPSVFAEEIVIIGPNSAQTRAYWVDSKTGELAINTPLLVQFFLVDGTWMIDYFGEQELG